MSGLLFSFNRSKLNVIMLVLLVFMMRVEIPWILAMSMHDKADDRAVLELYIPNGRLHYLLC